MRLLPIATRKSLLRDTYGAAAVEFAIIFPLLVLIMINAVVFYDAFRGSRLISRASSVTVDLITRYQDSFDNGDFQSIVGVAKAIAGPYAVESNFSIKVGSVKNEFDSQNRQDLELVWSRSAGPTKKLTQKDLGALDLPKIAEGDSVIVVIVNADYTPILLNDIVGKFIFEGANIRRPRFLKEIPCSGGISVCAP